MKVDNLSIKGTGHHFCQDYSLIDREKNLIIVADGCSGVEKIYKDEARTIVESYHQPEFGSMLLAQCALSVIKDDKNSKIIEKWNELGSKIIEQAAGIASFLKLDARFLNSTLMLALPVKDKIIGHIWGDGVLIYSNRDKKMEITEIEFAKNSPYYLIDLLLKHDHGNFYRENGIPLAKSKSIRTIDIVEAEEIIAKNEIITHKRFDEPFSFEYDIADTRFITLSSDGISSLRTNKGFNKISTHRAAYEASAFQSFQGEFVKRRLLRFQKDFKKMDFQNYDDLSIATIFNDEE